MSGLSLAQEVRSGDLVFLLERWCEVSASHASRDRGEVILTFGWDVRGNTIRFRWDESVRAALISPLHDGLDA